MFQAYRIAKNATITPITTNKDAPTVPIVTATLSNEGFKGSKETDSNEKTKITFQALMRFVSKFIWKKIYKKRHKNHIGSHKTNACRFNNLRNSCRRFCYIPGY